MPPKRERSPEERTERFGIPLTHTELYSIEDFWPWPYPTEQQVLTAGTEQDEAWPYPTEQQVLTAGTEQDEAWPYPTEQQVLTAGTEQDEACPYFTVRQLWTAGTEQDEVSVSYMLNDADDPSLQVTNLPQKVTDTLAVDSNDAVKNRVKRLRTSTGDQDGRRTRLPSSTSMHRTDIDENTEASLVEAVLHSKKQRKASKYLVEKLRKEGDYCQPVSCSDITWFLTTDMSTVSNIHLIVDTLMYNMLMKDGRLRKKVYSKFKELDKRDKRIFVFNTMQTEFYDLFHHIPPNARILLNDEPTTGQSSKGDVTKISGMTGGSSKDSIVTGTVDGNQCNVYGNVFNVTAGVNYEISSTRIRDRENGPSITIGQGAHPDTPNQLVITTDAENNQEVFDKITNNKEKLLSDHVRAVETEIGSVIIKLTVDKTHIMTATWIQTVLKTIFYDILGDFFTEGTKFHVTVERHICIGEEEFLKLYSSYQSHDDCVPKTEFESLKSKLDEMTEKHGNCNRTDERSLNIKQEPLDEEYEPFGGKPLSRKQLEGKPFCDTQLEKKQFKREAFEGKPFDKEQQEGEPFLGKEKEKRMNLYETDLEGLDWKTLKRESLEGKPFETFQSFKMRKFEKMKKVDPEMDPKRVETDHLMAEIKSQYADVMLDTQILKTEIYSGGRTYGKTGLKMLGYEDVVIDPEQKAVLQKAWGTCLRQRLQNLITSGSLDINHCNRKGMSLVMVSALKGDKDIFDLLLKNGCSLMDRLPNGDNILHLACLGGNMDIVDFILNCNIVGIESKGMYGRTPVMKAAGAGQNEVFDLLVRKGCRLNVVGKDHNKLIHVACMGDNVQIVKFLLEEGHADIESSGMFKRTPVMIAASLGKKRVFDLLVRHGCDLDVEGADENNLLHVACMSDCVEIVHFLISQAQVDMEAREIYGKTPVMIAAERGNRRVFDLLVRKGCDLLVEDGHGNNILHAAVKGGNLQIINDILLELHLDPDSKNYFGQTANSLAVAHSQVQVPQRYY